MGIDKSLSDDFPTVIIDGRKYHYGKETVYGQYLVENAEYAKDYWCFDTREDLAAFLVMLPDSADPNWFLKSYPNWSKYSNEERTAKLADRRIELRTAAAEKRKLHPGLHFNVLQFDDSNWYHIPADLKDICDSVNVSYCRQQRTGYPEELVVTLQKGDEHTCDIPLLRFSREQAQKVALALMRACDSVKRYEVSDK